MLVYAATLFLLSLLAAALGFTPEATRMSKIAKPLFLLFGVFFFVLMVIATFSNWPAL